MRLRFGSFLGVAVLFLLAFAAGSVEGNAASHVIEVTDTDLRDDPDTVENGKTAREKVQAKIDGADAGDVVQFPDGMFENVGELLFSVDGGEGEGEEIVVRGNVADPSAVVFTGKIMFNVTASNLVIEGFTFKDTKVPDRITRKRQDQDADDSNDDQYVITAPHDLAESGETGTVTINTLRLGDTGNCLSDFDKLLRNVRIRNNEFRNTEVHGIHLVDPLSFSKFSTGRCGSSDIVISGNVFTGIGFNGLYVDKERNIRWERNLVSAVKSYFPNRMTITDNVIDGTTYAGIMLNETFGKTVVRYNEVKNVPAFGIRIKGNRIADKSDYEVVVSDNRVSNTNNDPYITRTYNLYRSSGSSGIGPFKSAYSLTDKQVDEILKPEIWRVSPGANFGFRDTGAPRPVSDFADTEYNGAGARVAATASEIPQFRGGLDGTDGDLTTKRPCGDGSKLTVWKEDGRPVIPDVNAVNLASPAADWDRQCYSLVRFIDPALEAAIELSQLNAETIRIENNEITGNVAGILICERSGCGFRDPFNHLGSAKAAKVPTVIRGNNIYDNWPSGYVQHASSYAWGEAVNALDGDDNELDLSGNYLGERPRVLGNVKSLVDSTLAESAFDLSATAGPRASANDRTGPVLSESGDGAPMIDGGKTLTLMFDEPLDESSKPDGTAFTVMGEISSGKRAVYDVMSVDVRGMTVVLTLAGTVASGATITVSYDKPESGAALVDAAGNAVASFSGKTVRVAGMTGTDGGDGMMPSSPAGGAGGGGGCALVSAGSGGVDLGTLLPFVLAGLALCRMRRKSGEPR